MSIPLQSRWKVSGNFMMRFPRVAAFHFTVCSTVSLFSYIYCNFGADISILYTFAFTTKTHARKISSEFPKGERSKALKNLRCLNSLTCHKHFRMLDEWAYVISTRCCCRCIPMFFCRWIYIPATSSSNEDAPTFIVHFAGHKTVLMPCMDIFLSAVPETREWQVVSTGRMFPSIWRPRRLGGESCCCSQALSHYFGTAFLIFCERFYVVKLQWEGPFHLLCLLLHKSYVR